MEISASEALIEIDAYNGPILDLNTEYGKILCNRVSDNNIKYEFKRYVAKCGEAVAIKALSINKDLSKDKDVKDVLLKFCLPDKVLTKGNLLKGRAIKWLLLSENEREKNILSRPVRRFLDAAYIQKAVWKIANNDKFKYGYIPEVFEIGRTNFPFISMEYIDSLDLILWLQTQTNLARFKFFLNLVKLVEHYLHKHMIAHCDLTPENILIKNGMPVVIDFGLHKNFTVEKTITRNRDDMGKPLYRSPEMVKDPRDRDYQTDIFMLGRLLWMTWKADYPRDTRIFKGMTSSNEIFPVDELPIFLRSIFLLSTSEKKEMRYVKIEIMRQELETVSNDFFPKFRKQLIEGNDWKKYVKDIKNMGILEKIFSIIKEC